MAVRSSGVLRTFVVTSFSGNLWRTGFKVTITRITDRVLEGMSEWQNRPPDAVYPVKFIDCIHVKIREGQVIR